MSDFFEVFGLERRLAVDPAALQRRFYELSRQWHPDFHQGKSEAEQARALEESARVNAAYRALRDPIGANLDRYQIVTSAGAFLVVVDGKGKATVSGIYD